MKKIILPIFFLSSLVLATSCGKSNKVDSSNGNGASGASEELESTRVNFEGVYDLVRMDSNDCGASIRIIRECNGYQLISNNTLEVEEFCNVNRGQQRARDNGERNPPNPDRNPPNPDRNPNAPMVTQVNNELKSTVRINQNIAFTNTLLLSHEGVLTKISNLKSRNSRCIYQKR